MGFEYEDGDGENKTRTRRMRNHCEIDYFLGRYLWKKTTSCGYRDEKKVKRTRRKVGGVV